MLSTVFFLAAKKIHKRPICALKSQIVLILIHLFLPSSRKYLGNLETSFRLSTQCVAF